MAAIYDRARKKRFSHRFLAARIHFAEEVDVRVLSLVFIHPISISLCFQYLCFSATRNIERLLQTR